MLPRHFILHLPREARLNQPPPSIKEAIRSSLWGRSFTPDQLARVEATAVERAVPVSGFVCQKGEPVEFWLGVMEGLVKLCAVSREGEQVTLTAVPSGGWFGEGSILANTPYKYHAIAMRPTRMICVPRKTFDWLLDNSLGFNRFLLKQLNERLGQFISMVEYDRLLDPDTRVAYCLAGLFNPHLYPGVENRLQLSQDETGSLAGISRQRANQALHVLEQAGIIKVEYGAITILDLERLRNFGA